MRWPTENHVHDADYQAQTYASVREQAPDGWRPEKRDYSDPYVRSPSCWFCGSIQPQELHRILTTEQAEADFADWKYGWPHKLYVTSPNPKAGEECEMGAHYEAGARTPIIGAAPASRHQKFYSVHLREVTDPETFAAITELIHERTGVRFVLNGDRLAWRRDR